MKLKFILMMAVVLFMAACSDDEEEIIPTPAQEIAGTYTGTSEMAVMGASQGTVEDHKITMKPQPNGKIEMTISAFGEGAMAFTEDIVITDVEITKKDGIYTLKKDKIDTMSGERKVTGDLEATIKDGKANIAYNLIPGAMPMPINIVFTSK